MTFNIFAKLNLCKISHLAGLHSAQVIFKQHVDTMVIDTVSGNLGAPARDLLIPHCSLLCWAYGADLAVLPEMLNSQLADKCI